MAERASVLQKTQFGVESTAGTSVAANKFLPSLAFKASIAGNMTQVTSGGLRFPTGAAIGQEWMSWKMTGQPTYDELSYLFNSLLKDVSPTTVDTSARLWTYAPAAAAEDAFKTYTIEQGSSERAHKSVYNFMSELSLKGDRSKVEVDGMFFGQRFQDGITITASPTTVGTQVLMLPGEVSWYADTASAGLGTTKLTRVLKWEINYSGARTPLWVVDSSATSWSVPVERAPVATVKLTLAANAAGMAFVTNMRAGTKTFLRMDSTSPTIAGGTTQAYKLVWDVAAVVKETPKELKDEDGVYAIEYTFDMVYDSTYAKATEVKLHNKVTAL